MHEELRERLEARLDVLSRRVGKIEGDLRKASNPDWQERATELENDEVLEGLDASGLNELEQIRAALGRMDAGTFGICTGCEEPIDVRRLDAIPFSATCVQCAQ